jgi:hypothetical protein
MRPVVCTDNAQGSSPLVVTILSYPTFKQLASRTPHRT